ncbi:HD family hydrolase [Candidatus Peregrinibacteria bacterium]|nr:HD family hydrolase [Candidatus Peregrinibacteria bacterium]
MSPKSLLHFFFEIGNLRRIKHEGWRLAGVENPESVADHSLRAAQIGYVLAVLEKYKNPEEVCAMLVFHDIGECRVGDIHKVANYYIENVHEERAVSDQLKNLPEIQEKIMKLWKCTEERTGIAGKIAKDADLLEQALTAKEYLELGYKAAETWITTIEKLVHTNSAKELLKGLCAANSYDWLSEAKKKI